MSRYFYTRVAPIAWAILDGPRSLFAPRAVDSFGWLEPVLHIRHYPTGINDPAASASLYVDETVNRRKGFLSPVARVATWDRPADVRAIRDGKAPIWPSVRVLHHVLARAEERAMDRLLRRLDAAINRITFLRAGLIRDRSRPRGIPPGADYRNLRFCRWNNAQYMEFDFGCGHVGSEDCERVLTALRAQIESLCARAAARRPYKERYSRPAAEIPGDDDWDWRPYRAPK